MYTLLRPLLFGLDAERSHDLALGLLHALDRFPGGRRAWRALTPAAPALATTLMGFPLRNPVGLAAGLDKNARAFGPLAELGFGFLELGTVTPRPQSGNPRPRLFRLPAHDALINRMGFNNCGVERFLKNLARAPRPPCPIGINLGKNRDTPLERAVDDYMTGLRAVYAVADYVSVNVSSPNTVGLRALQDAHALEALLGALKTEQAALAQRHGRYVPIALKVAPDLDDAAIAALARVVRALGMDAVIATNTTVSRPGLEAADIEGGLSGRPLASLSTSAIRRLRAAAGAGFPIIGVGGVFSADDAWEKLLAGADAVQLYTGLIYRGPSLPARIVRGLAERVAALGARDLPHALSLARVNLSSEIKTNVTDARIK